MGLEDKSRDRLGQQVQTKEADVDHEIGEETGARKSHILQYEKYDIMRQKIPNEKYKIEKETGTKKYHISKYEIWGQISGMTWE